MVDEIMVKILVFLSSIALGLCGLIWRYQDRRLGRVESTIASLPHMVMFQDIAQIKTDIDWIKHSLRKAS